MIISVLGQEIDVRCQVSDIAEMMQFEGIRIQSLIERDIKPVSEHREWDRKRKITVSSRLTV